MLVQPALFPAPALQAGFLGCMLSAQPSHCKSICWNRLAQATRWRATEMVLPCSQQQELDFNAGVTMANKQSGSLANPTRLKPIKKQDGILQVIVETPKGCRNKFAF